MNDLKPFLQFCKSVGYIPTSYKVAMSYEEEILWLCDFLENTVIPAVNQNAEAVEDLQAFCIELKNYVDDYFDNLDIQTELNNKLDEMAESGELAELISLYLDSQAVIGFNTISSMAEAQNLADGSFVRVYGKLTYNDGKGAFYKVRELQNTDVPDGDNLVTLTETDNLVAEKISDYRVDTLEEEILKRVPLFKVKLTDTFNTIQSYFSVEGEKVIEFTKGTYTFTDTFRLNANTKIILNGSELIFNVPDVVTNWEASHGFFNFQEDDEFLAYSGNGNIEVVGGKITGGNFSFCHAKDISFKNIEFNLCRNDHIIELCAIDGCVIENCSFNGIYETSNNYKECINLDIASRSAFPFFSEETNPTYDNTPNKNIIVRNCKFTEPNTTNYTFDCAIGNHGIDAEVYHENIIIENNEINNSTNLGIDIYNFKNVIIKNNKFIGSSEAITNEGSHILTHKTAEDILIENNIFKGGFKAISYASPSTTGGYKKWNILNNTFIDFTHTTENISIINILAIDLCKIIGNLFNNILCGCIRTNYASLNSSNEYYIENNTFNSVNSTISCIKAYDGKNYINNNNFDVTFSVSSSAITLSSDSNVVYASGNKYNDHLINNDRTLYFGGYDNSRKNIENIKRGWQGTSSSLTSQALNDSLKFSDYKKILLTIGSGSETHTITLYAWANPGQAFLDARTYRIYFGSGYVEFVINSNETFNYSQSNTSLQLRNVALINENC